MRLVMIVIIERAEPFERGVEHEACKAAQNRWRRIKAVWAETRRRARQPFERTNVHAEPLDQLGDRDQFGIQTALPSCSDRRIDRLRPGNRVAMCASIRASSLAWSPPLVARAWEQWRKRGKGRGSDKRETKRSANPRPATEKQGWPIPAGKQGRSPSLRPRTQGETGALMVGTVTVRAGTALQFTRPITEMRPRSWERNRRLPISGWR